MKRRSITKPPDLIFFTDVDTGGHKNARLPSILIDAGLRVECHDDYFADGTKDSDWLSHCGEKGWIAITKDKRIRSEDRNIISIVKNRAIVFTLIGSWSHDMLAMNLVNSVYVVESKIRKHCAPFIAKIHMASNPARNTGRSGNIVIHQNRTELLDRMKRIGHQ